MDRPLLYRYEDIAAFVRDMIRFRKGQDDGFTVAKACKGLRRCSPALISNIIARKRRLTLDRVDDIAMVLGLSARERHQLRERLTQRDQPLQEEEIPRAPVSGKRRHVSSFLLKNWINPYVKDAVRLRSVLADPRAIYQELAGIASQERVDQALRFLLQNGYLRIDAQGRYVESEPLNVVGDKHADQKIRTFHKRALDIAKEALDLYPVQERLAQALLLPLDAGTYGELVDLIRQFAERLQVFSEEHADKNHRLYQLVIHLSPTGGHRE